jgi:ribonuclease HII
MCVKYKIIMLLPFYRKGMHEVGCDEAGRGCLAGPVVAAAVILPSDFRNSILNDSKKLSRTKREHLRGIIHNSAISYGIGVVDNVEIDEINILNASIKAMHLALDKLKPGSFNMILVDGNRFKPYKSTNHQCVIKGDGKYMSIAAASIIAKTYRDGLMETYSDIYPQYSWNKNAGYPTKSHREAIQLHGVTKFHRRSFRLLNDQLELFEAPVGS